MLLASRQPANEGYSIILEVSCIIVSMAMTAAGLLGKGLRGL